jgi:hypothetical protein
MTQCVLDFNNCKFYISAGHKKHFDGALALRYKMKTATYTQNFCKQLGFLYYCSQSWWLPEETGLKDVWINLYNVIQE